MSDEQQERKYWQLVYDTCGRDPKTRLSSDSCHMHMHMHQAAILLTDVSESTTQAERVAKYLANVPDLLCTRIVLPHCSLEDLQCAVKSYKTCRQVFLVYFGSAATALYSDNGYVAFSDIVKTVKKIIPNCKFVVGELVTTIQ